MKFLIRLSYKLEKIPISESYFSENGEKNKEFRSSQVKKKRLKDGKKGKSDYIKPINYFIKKIH